MSMNRSTLCLLLTTAIISAVQVPASAGLYRWFKLDEGKGEVATDSSSNKQHGSIENGANWIKDPVRGNVLELDGAANWVDAGELPIMNLENNFTWAFWENQSESQASPANDVIMGNRWGSTGQTDTSPREFIKFTPNRFEYHMNGGFANDMPYGSADPEHIPSDGNWRHHVVVKKGSLLTYYRDGEMFNDHELVDPMFSPDPLPFALGGQYGGETWAGLMSDVRLYDQALTKDEVKTVFKGGDPLNSGLLGDFDKNGVLDAADIDSLTKIVVAGTNVLSYDVNKDNLVNQLDRKVWVEQLKKTYVGDANLDGIFNSSDFVVVFQAGQYEDNTATNSTWGTGDWNGDLDFTSSDFVVAFQGGGYELGPRAAVQSVPEPNAALLLGLGSLWLGVSSRRRRAATR